MTGLDTSWNIESSEKQNKSDKDLYNELIRWFWNSYIPALDSPVKNSLIKDIMTQDSIAWGNIEMYLKRYIAENEEFTWLDISKINIFQLRRNLAGAFSTRKNNQELIKKEILADYDLSANEYSKSVEKGIEKLTDVELKSLLISQNDRKNKVEKILWRELLPNDQISILSSISESESAKRLTKMNLHERNKVLEVFERAKYRNLLDDADLQILIDSWYFWESEIKELVRDFIPHVTLQKAIDLWVISTSGAQWIKNSYIKKYTKDQWITLDSDTESEISSSLSFSEILVSSDELSLSAWDYKKIAQSVGFKNFENDIVKKNQQIQEELKFKGPATFELMKQSIISLNNPALQGFEKLQEWAVLQFSSSKDGETHKQYTKIIKKDDGERSFSFRNVGFNSINLSSKSELETIDYVNFVENLRKPQSQVTVMTQENVSESVESWAIETSELQSFTPEDFSGSENTEKRAKIRDKQVAQNERELEKLEKQLLENPDSTLIPARIKKKQSEIDDLLWSDIESEYAAERATYFSLVDKLDVLDSDGKSVWFEKGMFIETKDNAFEIAWLDIENEIITLKGLANPFEKRTFAEFLQWFKAQKATRHEALSTVSELVARVSQKQDWSKIELWSKGLIQKWVEYKGKDPEQPIEYLTSSESDTLVKIISVQDWFVEIQRWEQEDYKEWKWKKEVEWVRLKIKWAETETYSLNEFAKYIENEELDPNWKIGKTGLEVEPDAAHNDRNNGNTFWGWMWKIFVGGRMSLAELMKWGKMIPELVEEYWKKGSDIKSSKAALAMWKFLPKQMRDELLVKVERAEWESMEKALEDLWKIDSWMAVERIENWLLDKNTPEYNKEAWLLFMLSKYGHLTAKKWRSSGSNWLYPYRWKWLWYEAFGGRVNDALFLEKKAEVEADGQIFTEEYLMHMLLKKQCAWGWYNGVKRRSRLHKEYEWKWKSWVEEEFEKWYKDASNKRTAAKMVAEGMDEALWGTTTNALWWMKKAVERWWSLEDMMEISFSLLFSWAMYDLDQTTYLKAKWLWDGDGQPIISQRMMSSRDEMELFNRTVLELSKDIERSYPSKFWGISKAAQEISGMSKNRNNHDEPKRLKATQKFWKAYWKPLSKALNISMENDSDTSLTDTIIKRKKSENSTYKEYYTKVKWYAEETDNTFKQDFVEDAIWDTWVFGLNTYKLAKKYFETSQWWNFKKWKASENVFIRMREDVNSTPWKVMDTWPDGKHLELNSRENRAIQKSYIIGQLTEISAGLLAAHGWNKTALWALNNQTSMIWSQLNAWGINIVNDLWTNSAEELKNWEKSKFFERVASRIISGGTHWEFMWETPVELRVSETKDSAAKATSPQIDPWDGWRWADD